MSPLEESTKKAPLSKKSHFKRRYVIRPLLHPNDWKLEITDDVNQSLFEVTRRLTSPIRYRVQAIKSSQSEQLVIKTSHIGDIIRYSLLKKGQELLSLRYVTSSTITTLRDQNRNAIARFTPLTPEITLLRAASSSVARLRYKESPTTLGFTVECEVTPEQQWLLGVLLYVIAYIATRVSVTHPAPEALEETKEAEDPASP